MPWNNDVWKLWGKRLRSHLKENDSNLATLAEAMDLSEPTLRSWTNGTRKVNLEDFFEACRVAKADPALILFGRPTMSEDLRKNLGELAASILEADPSSNAHYGPLMAKLKTATTKRRV